MIYSKLHGPLSFSQGYKEAIDNQLHSEKDFYQRCERSWKVICRLSALDALTLTEYYRACGAYSRSRALLRVAKSLYPEDAKIAVSWAHYLSTTKSPLAGINYLAGFRAKSDEDELLVKESKVRFCSEIGFVSEIKTLFNEEQYANNAALQSKVSYALRQWDEARIQTEQALRLSPDDPYLRKQLIDILLAIGDESTTRTNAQYLVEIIHNRIAEIDHYLIFVFFVLGDIDYSTTLAKQYLKRWLYADNLIGIKCWLIRFLALNDQQGLVAKWVYNLPDSVKSTMEPLAQKQSHRILNMPIACQGKDMCVPTAIGMMCHFLGVDVDSDRLYQEMGGVEGTELWRAHDVMESKGLYVNYVDLDLTTIKRLIDEGVPILAQTSGLFSSHIEVINGYDDAEQCIYIRDPANWYPTLIKYDHIQQRYASAGNYGMCFTRNGIKAQFNSSEVGVNLTQLARSCETGTLDDIIPLVEKLRNYPEFELDVTQQCYGVTLDPITYENKLTQIIKDQKTPEYVKTRGLLKTTNVDVLKAWLKENKNKSTGSSFLNKYIGVIHDYLNANWKSCVSALMDLINLYPYQSSLWLFHAETALEVGDIDRALKSAKFALELSPDSLWTINRIFYLFPHFMTYKELLGKLQFYESKRPNSISAIEFAAQLYWEGASGELFEKKALECIDRRPKLPNNYTRLANWYLNQERADLAKQVLDKGREQLGQDQLPLWEFEKQSDNPNEGPAEDSKQDNAKKVNQFELEKRLAQVLQDDSLGSHARIDALREIFFDGVYIHSIDKNIELTKLLSHNLPGVFPHNLSYFLDGFNFPYLENSAQKMILNWSLRVIGNQTCSLDLDFHIAYLTELLGDYSTAEQIYREIAERYSGHSGSQYRLGMLEQRRGNLNEAVSKHEKALEHSPSLVGSIDSLIDLNSKLSRTEEVIKWCRYRADFRPYDMTYLETLLEQLVYGDTMEKALAELENRKRFCPAEYFIFHQSRIYVDAGLFTKALEVTESVNSENARHLWVTKLIAFKELGRFEEALTVCDNCLDQAPNDNWFKAKMIDLLESLEQVDKAIKLSEQQIREGDTSNHYIAHYFQLKNPSVEDIKLLLKGASENAINEGVEAIASAAQYYLDINEWKDLLIFINKAYPNAFHARISLSYRYMMAQDHNLAIEIAEDVYNRSKKNEEWLYPLGKVYEDTRREEALKLYKKYYDRTGDIDALIDIGRCFHLKGDLEQAKHYYQKAVSLNPFAELAVNNLVQMGGNIASYADDYFRMIDASYGSTTQYFCVNAVKCAIKANKTVSPNWINVAEERLKIIEIEKPFKDEPQRLSLAIYQWYLVRGDKEKARNFKKQAGFKGILLSLMGWPASKWVPEAI